MPAVSEQHERWLHGLRSIDITDLHGAAGSQTQMRTVKFQRRGCSIKYRSLKRGTRELLASLT